VIRLAIFGCGKAPKDEMARLYNVSAPTVSHIVAAHRTDLA
jgi:hypothetical protein